MKIDQDELAVRYRRMSDVEFRQISRDELTDEAKEIFDRELARRHESGYLAGGEESSERRVAPATSNTISMWIRATVWTTALWSGLFAVALLVFLTFRAPEVLRGGITRQPAGQLGQEFGQWLAPLLVSYPVILWARLRALRRKRASVENVPDVQPEPALTAVRVAQLQRTYSTFQTEQLEVLLRRPAELLPGAADLVRAELERRRRSEHGG
jgi:hypothetical protein